MTPERFRQVRDVADAALNHPEAERPAFLAEACAGKKLRSRHGRLRP